MEDRPRLTFELFTNIQDECAPVPEPFATDTTQWVYLYVSDMPDNKINFRCMASRHRQQKPKGKVLELIVDLPSRKYYQWVTCQACHEMMKESYAE